MNLKTNNKGQSYLLGCKQMFAIFSSSFICGIMLLINTLNNEIFNIYSFILLIIPIGWTILGIIGIVLLINNFYKKETVSNSRKCVQKSKYKNK